MTRIVLDTNVLIAALRSRNGASFKLLSLVGTGTFETVVSVPLVIEYEYAALKTASEIGLQDSDVSTILDYLCKVSLHQDIFFLWRPVLRDPSDDMILEAAMASSAAGIVAFNTKDFGNAELFDLSIWTPKQFLMEENLI